jgi:hypothetical protein
VKRQSHPAIRQSNSLLCRHLVSGGQQRQGVNPLILPAKSLFFRRRPIFPVPRPVPAGLPTPPNFFSRLTSHCKPFERDASFPWVSGRFGYLSGPVSAHICAFLAFQVASLSSGVSVTTNFIRPNMDLHRKSGEAISDQAASLSNCAGLE